MKARNYGSTGSADIAFTLAARPRRHAQHDDIKTPPPIDTADHHGLTAPAVGQAQCGGLHVYRDAGAPPVDANVVPITPLSACSRTAQPAGCARSSDIDNAAGQRAVASAQPHSHAYGPVDTDMMSVLPNVAGQSWSGQGAGRASVPVASEAAR
jgi:hypothetical protein